MRPNLRFPRPHERARTTTSVALLLCFLSLASCKNLGSVGGATTQSVSNANRSLEVVPVRVSGSSQLAYQFRLCNINPDAEARCVNPFVLDGWYLWSSPSDYPATFPGRTVDLGAQMAAAQQKLAQRSQTKGSVVWAFVGGGGAVLAWGGVALFLLAPISVPTVVVSVGIMVVGAAINDAGDRGRSGDSKDAKAALSKLDQASYAAQKAMLEQAVEKAKGGGASELYKTVADARPVRIDGLNITGLLEGMATALHVKVNPAVYNVNLKTK